MNIDRLLIAVVLMVPLGVFAEEGLAVFNVSEPVKATTEWKYDPAVWRDLFAEKRDEPTIAIGRSDVVVRGPMVDTFRRPRSSRSDLSLGQKILSLPVINLFVPMKMPSPPAAGGKYFAWGKRDSSSSPFVSSAAAASGGFNREVNHEPTGLIQIGW
jgi:hypothetical protein